MKEKFSQNYTYRILYTFTHRFRGGGGGERAWGSNGLQMDHHHLLPGLGRQRQHRVVPDELFPRFPILVVTVSFGFYYTVYRVYITVYLTHKVNVVYKETGHFFFVGWRLSKRIVVS